MLQHKIDGSTVRGIGFAATCSLVVMDSDFRSISVTASSAGDDDHNIILWLDHRASKETALINDTQHNILRYVGGKVSIEMELSKMLWLKRHMSGDTFARCHFYDLSDALTTLATGQISRSFCGIVCKQGYIPPGVDDSKMGWQRDFLHQIGLDELCDDNFRRLGGINGVVSQHQVSEAQGIHLSNTGHIQNGTHHTAGDQCGTLCDKAASDTDLPSGIPIGSGVIDAYAGWIGTVGADISLGSEHNGADGDPLAKASSRLAAVAGTSTCHLVLSKQPTFVDGVWGPYRDVVIPGYCMTEGGQSATGELLRHILETHPAFLEAVSMARISRKNIYEYLTCESNKMQHVSHTSLVTYSSTAIFLGTEVHMPVRT